MIIELDLDPSIVAQIDLLARRLGIQAVGEDRERKLRSEVVRRLLVMWEAKADLGWRSEQARLVGAARAELDDGKRFCSVCRRRHGPEVVHPCE